MYLLSSHLTQHINLDLFNSLMQNLYEFLPIALGIIVYIMVAWITVRIIVFSLRKILKVTRLEHLSNKLNDNDILRKSGITFNLTPIVTTPCQMVFSDFGHSHRSGHFRPVICVNKSRRGY